MKRSRDSTCCSETTTNNEEDDLDKLLDHYEAQAALDLKQACQPGPAPPRQLKSAQRREAALHQPLDAQNKGFKMLTAMGYQAGQGLGKSAKGRSEPIPLDLKHNRLGLGAISKKAAAREVQKHREVEAEERRRRAQQDGEASIQVGRQRTAELFAAKREQAQLRKAQQVCETLDEAAGITSNHLWLPPPEEEDGPMSKPLGGRPAAGHAEMLSVPRERQRGKQAQGAAAGALRVEDELLEEGEGFRRDITGPGQEHAERGGSCEGQEGEEKLRLPGKSMDAGTAGAAAEASQRESDLSGPQAAAALVVSHRGWYDLPVAQRLHDVLQYMRNRHRYCMYCCCRYEDDADLQTHCPGVLEDDHE